MRHRDCESLLYEMQDLVLHLIHSTGQPAVVHKALEWVAGLGFGAAIWLSTTEDASRLQAHGIDDPTLQALQALLAEDPTSAAEAQFRDGPRSIGTLRELDPTGRFSVLLLLPLAIGDYTYGTLAVCATPDDPLEAPTIRLLELLARHVALALEHIRRAAEHQAHEALVEQRHNHLRRAYDLVTSERRTLAAVLDSASDAVLVTDAQGVVQIGNPALETVLGIHPDLLIGDRLDQADVPEQLVMLVRQALASCGREDGELPLPDGRLFHVSIAPIQTFEGPVQGYVALLKDVTSFKRLDEMKSQFVATVSHDLKSPLHVINGYAELIEDSGPLNAEQLDCVRQIMRGVQRLSALVADLLDLGRIEAGVGFTMGPCDMGMLVDATVSAYRLLADEKQIDITVRHLRNLPPVWADERRLQQVIGNLLSNAIAYTPPGGIVRIWYEVDRDQMIVRVQDSGIGINPRDVPHLFEPFYRSSNAPSSNTNGTGLGLTIVKRIVDEHQGAIGIESSVNGGTTFWFTVPLALETTLDPEP